jgi:GT2 family glycosyltransferase
MFEKEYEIGVTAIVVTYNSAGSLANCLTALTEEIDEIGGEIIVFDNNSNDDTTNIIKSRFPKILLIESGRNIGFGAANNAAAKLARGKYLFFANPDMFLDNGSLRALMDTFESYPDSGAVVARLRNTDGSFQPTCRNFPNFYNIFFSRGSVLNHKKLAVKAGKTYTIGDFNEVSDVPAASAACMLIDKQFFKDIGGFDQRFFLFMEDTDLSLRIYQAGRKIYFVPQASALHHWGKGSSVSPIKRSWYHHISVWRYYLKHYPNGFSLFVLPMALAVNFVLRSFSGYDPH